jgi:hypothetical protein
MTRLVSVILLVLTIVTGGFWSASLHSHTTTLVNCGTCDQSACSAPLYDATSGTHQIDVDTANIQCNTADLESLRCGKSKHCMQLPIPQGCPGHGAQPPVLPVDVWRCRFTTIAISGYSSCTNCWQTALVFPCCELES